MMPYQGIFLASKALLKSKIFKFSSSDRASISVEMAFILPLFAVMAFLSFDAGTVYTQYKRGSRHYYALGDVLSAQTQNVTCNQLDKISEVVYDSYAEGNWARRPRPSGNDFTKAGALDFRFALKLVKTEKQADNSIKGRIQWAYWRHWRSMNRSSEDKPGDLVDIPEGLQIEGLEFVHVDGSLFIAPKFNYLGVFDYHPSSNKTHKEIEIDRYFPLRFMTGLNIDFDEDDPLDKRCWVLGQSYPDETY